MYLLTTMNDSRWEELAEVFCESTGIGPGDKVLLHAIELDTLPLLFAIYKKGLEKGASYIDYQIEFEDINRHMLQHSNDEQIDFFPKWKLETMKEMDVYIGIRARMNGLLYNDISNEIISRHRSRIDPITKERISNTRWCITRVPTDYDAAMAEMNTQEYIDYYFNATIQDYSEIKKRNLWLKDLMEKTDNVRIVAQDGTDISFSIKGIPVQECHGERNIPGGETFTSPVINSVNGRINYNTTSVYEGKVWSGISLLLKDGVIIEANCNQGKKEINAILDTDEGARRIGEFALGTNPGIKRSSSNSLFDEKMLGSFHLTPGSSHEHCSNGNNSMIHWDLVKIMNQEYGGGIVFFDRIPIMINGQFISSEAGKEIMSNE